MRRRYLHHVLALLIYQLSQAIVYAQSRPSIFGDIYSSVKAILFFGTPHQGANAAVWATYLGHISKAVGIRRANVTKELQTWSNELVELTTLFSEQIPDLSITTFFEMQPTYGVIVSTPCEWQSQICWIFIDLPSFTPPSLPTITRHRPHTSLTQTD
jgi:hypothetical protein